jgi:hypothetical protein
MCCLLAADGASAAGQLPRWSVREHNGAPTLFRDDQPIFFTATAQWVHGTDFPQWISDFRRAGVRIYQPRFQEAEPRLEKATEAFDATLAADPDALFLPIIWVGSRAYGLDEGEGDSAAPEFASMASAAWRERAGAVLRKLVTDLEQTKYAERIIGYHVAGGNTAEWFYPNTWTRKALDRGPAMTSAYRAWLRERFRTAAAMRAAYGDATLEFETIEVPSAEEIKRVDEFPFLDPARSARLIDYWQFHSALAADDLVWFCQQVKQAADGRVLAGAFYGYIFEFNRWLPLSGHLAMERVLGSDAVDFLVSPTSYQERQVGGYSGFMSAQGSVRLHGKLWIDESDQFTFLSKEPRTKTEGESREVNKRDFAVSLTSGAGIWWYDDRAQGTYGTAGMMADIARMREIGDFAVTVDRGSVADVALLVDEVSPRYQVLWESPLNDALARLRFHGLARAGVAFDSFLLSDAERLAGRYRLYVVGNACALTAERRRTVKRALCRDGAVVLWLYAPGLIDDAIDAAGVSDLIEMTVRYAPGPAKIEIEATNADHPITRTLAGKIVADSPGDVPALWVDDQAATALGRLRGTDRVGLAIRKFDDWTSIYVTAPSPTPGLLREIARFAGAHVWHEADDVLYVDRLFLALHTRAAGAKRIALPRESDVVDLFTGEIIARDSRGFTVDLPAGVTRIYFTGRAESLPEALLAAAAP